MTYPQPIGFSDLLGWDDEDYAEILSIFQSQTDLAIADLVVAARKVNPSQARAFFQSNFQPLRFGPALSGHITGYYEPVLSARAAPDAEYRFPLYAAPKDMPEIWATRAEIETGNLLSGQGLELGYLNSRIDQYFCHIQGSVAVTYPDGETRRFGFSAKNGHPYRSIGAELVAMGEISAKQITADWVKDWLRHHPDQMDALLRKNPSYIFFEPRHENGAVGAAGQVLTANRSIAIDPAYIPYGLPVMVAGETRAARTYFAQDCGSAIKGAQRADIFCGSGDAAGRSAGAINEPASLTVLWPKGHDLPNGRAG